MNAENHLISKAIESDERGDFDEALACYKSGVEILLKERLPKCNETEREILKSKISEYLSRAEHLKKITTLRRCRKTFNIEHDEVGKGYRTVFSSIFATTFSKMKILDPYIIHPHQFDNLMLLITLLLTLNPKIQQVTLITHQSSQWKERESSFDELNRSLQMISPQLKLILEYDGQLHDRRIELDNGIVVSMGRGLDYFQKTTRHSIQFHETELRRCKKTVIDIYWK